MAEEFGGASNEAPIATQPRTPPIQWIVERTRCGMSVVKPVNDVHCHQDPPAAGLVPGRFTKFLDNPPQEYCGAELCNDRLQRKIRESRQR